MTEPADFQPPDSQTSPQAQPQGAQAGPLAEAASTRKLSRPLVLGTAAAVVLAGAAGAGLALSLTGGSDGSSGGSGASSRGSGTVTLTVGISLQEPGTGCDTGGIHGYDDIAPGMPVTVEDETHEVLASTSLPARGIDPGDPNLYDGCLWEMKIQVPDDRKQYAVTAGRRGTVTFARSELVSRDWEAVLSIG